MSGAAGCASCAVDAPGSDGAVDGMCDADDGADTGGVEAVADSAVPEPPPQAFRTRQNRIGDIVVDVFISDASQVVEMHGFRQETMQPQN